MSYNILHSQRKGKSHSSFGKEPSSRLMVLPSYGALERDKYKIGNDLTEMMIWRDKDDSKTCYYS